MSELMTIQALTMSSREIAELTGKRHDHVMVDCRKLLDFYAETYSPEKAGEYVKSSTYTDSTGRALPCYELNKQASLDLVTGYSLAHRHAVNVRWQELEAGQFKPPAELTRMEILELAMQAEKGRIEAERQLALAAPKVNFFDKVVERTTLMTATQVAQKLGMSAIKLNKHLEELDVYSLNVKRARTFKQWVLDKGFGQLKQTELGYSQPLFTTAGEAWIVERLTSEGVAC